MVLLLLSLLSAQGWHHVFASGHHHHGDHGHDHTSFSVSQVALRQESAQQISAEAALIAPSELVGVVLDPDAPSTLTSEPERPVSPRRGPPLPQRGPPSRS